MPQRKTGPRPRFFVMLELAPRFEIHESQRDADPFSWIDALRQIALENLGGWVSDCLDRDAAE